MSRPDITPAEIGHERKDLPVNKIFLSLVILSVTTFVCAIIGLGLHYLYLKYDQPRLPAMSPMANMHRLPPEPRLQVDDAADLVQFKQAEDAILNSYGWVDPNSGQVRIPVDRAIDLLAERGLPARKGGTQ